MHWSYQNYFSLSDYLQCGQSRRKLWIGFYTKFIDDSKSVYFSNKRHTFAIENVKFSLSKCEHHHRKRSKHLREDIIAWKQTSAVPTRARPFLLTALKMLWHKLYLKIDSLFYCTYWVWTLIPYLVLRWTINSVKSGTYFSRLL